MRAPIEESYQLLRPMLADAEHTLTPAQTRAAYVVLVRVCAFEELARHGDQELWAGMGQGRPPWTAYDAPPPCPNVGGPP